MKLGLRFLRQIPAAQLYLIITVFFGTLLGAVIILQASFLSQIINNVFLRAQSLRQVWNLMLLLLGIIALRGLLSWGGVLAANQIAGHIKTSARQHLLARLNQLGPLYTRGERSGELINTLNGGVEALDPYFSQYFPQIFLAAIVPTIIVITVFRVDLSSGIFLLVMIPILLFLLAIAGMMAGTETRRHWKALSLMSAHFLDTLQGLTTLKLFGHSEAAAEQVRDVSERFRQTTMNTLRIAFFSSFILEEGATISAAIIAVEVGLRLLIAQMPFQTALFVLLLTPEFFLPLRLVAARYHAGMTGSVALQRIVTILETTAPSQAQGEPSMVTQLSIQPVQGSEVERVSAPDIRLEHISFTYDGRRPALRDISFHVAPGQKVALVGPSGAGKTTIAHLLLRFIEAESGLLSIGGMRSGDISAQEWRKQIAWVPQHPYLFNATVADNIRLGRPQASMEEVREAARLAHADTYIQALQQGYDTVIGEQGARLSGGEAQCLSLARAFLKNAPLLILDEATSYLDPEHEAEMLESLAHLEAGRTVLLIAHRLSAVYHADSIVVLDEGRIVDIGTHRALAQQSGVYQRFLSSMRKGKLE
jgi:ATP-binding cassette subfamily C protein CydD